MSVLLIFSVGAERRSHEQQLLATARAISTAVDQRLVRAMALNEAIATSDAVQRQAWDEAKARSARLGGPASWMVLIDNEGRQIFNTNARARPTGPTFPLPPNIQQALTTGRSQISDLIRGTGVDRYLVAVDTPLKSGGRDYVVAHMLGPEQFLADFASVRTDGALITMIDGNHKVVARSRNHSRFLAADATSDMKRAVLERPDGVVFSRSLEGEASVVAYDRSSVSGWTTMVVVPRARFEAPLWRSLLGVAGVTMLAGLAAVLGARLFFRTISQELHLLQADAVALGHGQGVESRPGLISNFAEVQTALSEASHELSVRDERQRLMINELNHRVKNTLATVQSLAAQTFREVGADARVKFEERLTSLAYGHDLLTTKNWEQVELAEIVTLCGRAHEERIRARGPSLPVQPHAALALCMCLHELMTNSVKYGALSAPSGVVDIVWTPCAESGRLRLEWRETGGPPAEPPARAGFGTRLIDRLMRHELAGRVERRFEPEGLVLIADIGLAAVSRWRNDFGEGGERQA